MARSALFNSCIIALLFILIRPFQADAQSKDNTWEIAGGAGFPLGSFAETHAAGMMTEVSYSDHRFGNLFTLPRKKAGYLLQGGVSHYFGRKESVSAYPFRYGGYLIFHSYAGGIYNWGRKTSIRLAAGPAISRYEKNWRFNIGSSLTGSWYFKRQWGARAVFGFLDETRARPLWSVSFSACYAF